MSSGPVLPRFTAAPLAVEDVLQLATAGIAAPSADNRHVVTFEPHGASLRLHADASVVTGAPPHRTAFNELAFGAVIENIVLAASGCDRSAIVHIYPGWRNDGIVADIKFGPPGDLSDPDANWLRAAIFERCTNRRLFAKSKPAPRAVRDDLVRVASVAKNLRVHWLDNQPVRWRALVVLFRAERERFCNVRLHKELFDAVRLEVGWKGTAESGLPPAALEIERPFRPLFRALGDWRVQRTVNVLGAAQLLALRAAWLPAWTAPHLALLSAPLGSVDWIDAGRAMQRLWLGATRHGLAFHPLAAPVALSLQPADDPWASAAACERIRSGLQALADGRQAIMLARLGFAPPPAARTGRPAVQTFLSTATTRG